MVRPTRIKQILNLPDIIKDTAWNQIAECGAPEISLRAIARALKITAPAIYNYFPSRDDLVTALIVDAFNSLAESQKKSILAIPLSALELRLVTLGLAYREWALLYPQRYQLIFGTPIPSYAGPEDITNPAAAWALVPLIETLQALYDAGKLRVEGLPKLTPSLESMLEAWRGFVIQSMREVHLQVLYLTYVIWSRVHGLMMLEIGHQYPAFITEPGEIYRCEIESIHNQYT